MSKNVFSVWEGNHMNTKSENLGFIGAGNMASALIKGLIQSGLYEENQISVFDKNEEAMRTVSGKFMVNCDSSNKSLVKNNSTVVLSIKPQNMMEVLEEIRTDMRENQLIISVAAGIPLSMIRSFMSVDIPMIRVMPNTPALVQKGISALASGPGVKPEHMALAKGIFDAVGETVIVEENMMDAVTALSGSGPGYVFRIMECMVEAGVAVGLAPETAKKLTIQTFLGAAYLARDSEDSLGTLREKVTSPGGTTAAGLAVFDERGLKDILVKAIDSACKRGEELGK